MQMAQVFPGKEVPFAAKRKKRVLDCYLSRPSDEEFLIHGNHFSCHIERDRCYKPFSYLQYWQIIAVYKVPCE